MPAPVLLTCREISKAFGERPLFERLTFAIHEGDRIGLVGPNGTGKSTLLRILAGEEAPDAGECARRKGISIAVVPQRPEFEPGSRARGVVEAAIASTGRLEDREIAAAAAVALGRAGFDDPDVAVDTLSGGWKTRLALAAATALEPDLLLLDEPTNHLDLESILQLEATLKGLRSAFVVVSHDRAFLQAVAGRVLEIDRRYAEGLLAVDGTYADLLEAREAKLAAETARREALANHVRREVEWLRRGPKARTSKSRARIDAAERSIEELAEARERSRETTIGVDVTASGRKTKRLWAAEGVTKRYGDRTILEAVDLELVPGMRLGVLGANGTGKTTLLEIVVGELSPDEGRIRRADGLRVVYFDQTRESVDPSLTLRRALAPEGDQVVYRGEPVHVVTWARRFLFRKEQLPTTVARLSGGERARIVLARMMLRPADVLVLDEPTNDLDIDTLEVLEDALLEFPGALVLVTHDRRMLDRIATTILALDGKGGVERYADAYQWIAERERIRARAKREASDGVQRARDPRPRDARPKKLSYLDQREWDGMEASILDAETRLEEAIARAEDPAIASDARALEECLAERERAQAEVDRLYARWAELEAKLH